MRSIAVVSWVALIACGGGDAASPPPVVSPVVESPPSSPEPEAVVTKTSAPPPNPQDVATAQKLLEKGEELYGEGRYDEAEDKLKRALIVYPFLPNANLLLGKIFLIRASASRDVTLMNNARLMFEMARALDPNGEEVRRLLRLFHSEGGP